MINRKELDAMVYLLDDPDVSENISNKLVSLGREVVPMLEEFWFEDINAEQKKQLEAIILAIQSGSLQEELKEWMQSEKQNLLQAIGIINRIKYPENTLSEIEREIEQLRMDTWLELQYDLTAFEKIRLLNYVFFQKHGYKGTQEHYNNPDNSFLHKVIESKKGNPISLCILYSLVAQRLNIPVFGINLPQHFILGYADLEEENETLHKGFGNKYEPQADEDASILFYINPFNKGSVFGRQQLDSFLDELKLPHQKEFYMPCSNTDIVRRILKNLHNAYSTQNNAEMLQKITLLLECLEEK